MSAINSTTSVNPLLDPQKVDVATKPVVAQTGRGQDSVTISDAVRSAQGGGDKDSDGDSQ